MTTTTATELPTLRTNLAEYAVTKAMRDGRVKSDLVKLDFCGPTPAHGPAPHPRRGISHCATGRRPRAPGRHRHGALPPTHRRS